MKYLKNLFQSKYFKPIISVFFVAVASIFTGYFIVNGANYMSSNFLNIDSGGAYIYGNPTGNGLIVANGKVGIGTTSPGSFTLAVNGQVRVNDLIGSGNLRIAGSGNDKYVAILGGGGTSPSENEGAAIYARGRWDSLGAIFQVFTPNTSIQAVERFRIESGDAPVAFFNNISGLGIGTALPQSKLSVGGTGDPSTVAFFTGSESTGIFSKGANYGVRGYSTNSSGYDFYAAGSGTNYGPFTGGHEVILSDTFPKDAKRGLIVSVTDETKIRKDEKGEISISSTLPKVKLSNTANDKTVLGVFASEVPLPDDHWYISKKGERFAVVNALGEGRVLVTDINGGIQAGDYITTSVIPGYGQLQSDDLMHSYTVGKATENVDWEKVTETIGHNGEIYKVYLIGIVYTSG